MKSIITTSITVLALFWAPTMGAQSNAPDSPHSVKANVGIGLGNAYSTTSSIIDTDKSSNTTFGVDYRYRFWSQNDLSLGINAGLAYSAGSISLSADKISFDYEAAGNADMDGNTYKRFTTLSDVSQKVSLSEFAVPISVDFNWQLSQRFALYAETGIGLRFSTSAKAESISGACEVYGVYPQYGNLKMDDDWLNDFGDLTLSKVTIDKPEQNTFTMNLFAGVGCRVWLYGPLSLECGLRYEHGFMNRLKSTGYVANTTSYENAPMTYTVADGRNFKPLSSALNNSNLSSLKLNVGLILNF